MSQNINIIGMSNLKGKEMFILTTKTLLKVYNILISSSILIKVTFINTCKPFTLPIQI